MKLLSTLTTTEGASRAIYLKWATETGTLVESSILYLKDRDVPWVYCLPSTVACSMGCRICAMPRSTNPEPLRPSQLWNILQKSLKFSMPASKFQVSFMGQGEPFLNSKNIFGFCEELINYYSEAIIGISTVGIAGGIRNFSGQKWAKKVKLQLSLHAWPPTRRCLIVPAEICHPIEHALKEAKHFAHTNETTCCLNCVLINNLNDSELDARHIASIAKSGPFYVKISSYNPYPGANIEPASEESIQQYCFILKQHDVPFKRFKSVGTSIGAGCGQTRLLPKSTPSRLSVDFLQNTVNPNLIYY